MLTSRVVTRLRALVVLPTRNLQQVRQIFEACWRGTRLKAIVSDYPVKVLTTTLGRHGHRPVFFYPRTSHHYRVREIFSRFTTLILFVGCKVVQARSTPQFAPLAD